MSEKLLGIKEVAEYLGVTTRTVQSYLNETDPELRLNGILLGNRWRVEEKDVREFIDRRRKYSERKKAEEANVA
jgi:excisionase family DNA binding protein